MPVPSSPAAEPGPAARFNLKLAVECADAFSGSTGLACTVSDLEGNVLHENGYGCASCSLCTLVRETADAKASCRDAHQYGMREAERFGGKYIYFCPMGLACFVSPIMGEEDGLAKVTVGPFLMVDRDDYVNVDLRETARLSEAQIARACETLDRLPYVDPERVTPLSSLLFMAVGFLNNVAAGNRMLETQGADAIQGQISDYITQLKLESPHTPPRYPLEKERALLQSIAESDKAAAQQLLNELLGHIFFASGGSFEKIKARVYELLVLISRASIDGGADPEYAFEQSRRYLQQVTAIDSIEELCFWLTDALNRFADSAFRFTDVKHVDVIHKAVRYVRKNYSQKISLEEAASAVYLSPSYFSKVFKQEMGCNFNTYLNTVRIEKSKELLLNGSLRLVDIAYAVGFEDQSYFTKVFKRLTGFSPCKFKESRGRRKPNRGKGKGT